MRDNKTIEQQAAELTEEQKNRIMLVYKFDTSCFPIVVAISAVLFLVFKNQFLADFVDTKILWYIFGSMTMGLLLLTFVIFKIIVAITVPYYSKHIARYLHTSKK